MIRAAAVALLVGLAGCAAPAGEEVDARAAFGLARSDPAREIAEAFDPAADAMADVDAALARAGARDAKTLIVLGGNWCHDSRGFAWLLEQPEVAPVLAGYELVFVDVGFRDRNLDVPQRFGVERLEGTPTVLVVSPEGALLNADSVEEWRTASQREPEDVAAYLSAWTEE